MTNTPLQAVLTEMVKNLEAVAANVGAMELALVEQGFLTLEQTDSHRLASLQSVKSALANARWMISHLPET